MTAAQVEDDPVLTAALVLAECGLSVAFGHCVRPGAGCSCGAACSSPGKHPIGGKGWQERATADPERIRVLRAAHPLANLGVATGAASRIAIIDIDGAEGEATIAALDRKYGQLPKTVTVLTSRGRHLYFALPAGVTVPNRVGRSDRGIGVGVDLRGEGGFAIVPPSVHASGFVYRFAPGLGLADIELAVLPQWVVDLVADRPASVSVPPGAPPMMTSAHRNDRYARAGLDKECARVAKAAKGCRNDTLNEAAFNVGLLVAGGLLGAGDARAALIAAAGECGLGEREAGKTITSAFAGAAQADARTGPARDLPPAVTGTDTAGDEPGVEAPPGRVASVIQLDSKRPAAQAPEPPPSRMVPLYSTAQLFASLPPQRWAVQGLQIGPGRPMLATGYGASAKSIAMQQLLLAVASGTPVFGHFPCAPGRVLHIDYEQTYYATAKRYQRLARGHGIDPRALESRLDYIELPRAYLDDRDAIDQYMRTCEGYDVVLLDALRGAAPRSDENDSAFRGVLDGLLYVSQRCGPAFIVIHHAGKPKEGHADKRTLARGSSAIFDATGCMLNFTAQPDSTARLVTQVKVPAEAEGVALEPFELVVTDCDGGDGVRVDWRVPVVPDHVALANAKFERDALRVIDAVRAHQGRTSNTIVARCGMPKQRALEMLKALAEEGRLTAMPGARRAVHYSTLDHVVSHD